MRRAFLAAGLLALVAALTWSITLLDPAPIDRATSLQPARDSKLVCAPAGPAGTIAATGATAGAALGQDRAPLPGTLDLDAQSEPYVVTGDSTLRGVTSSATDTQRDLAACVPARAEGIILAPGTADTELLLVNSDPTDASIDLTVLGSDGEIPAVGGRGIAISAGASRVIALSVLADVEGPVAVEYRASRGRASVFLHTAGQQVLDTATSSTAATESLLTGIPAGDQSATLLLANPSDTRATAQVTAYGVSAPYTPQGGDSVSVPPHSTVAVTLGPALAGEATGLRVTSDQPLTSGLVLGTPDVASVTATIPDTELSGVTGSGGSLVLTNPGDVDATVTVRPGEAEPTEVQVAAGTTAASQVPGGGVLVESSVPILGAVSLIDDGGSGAVVLVPAGGASEALDAVVDPGLG